MMRSIVFTLLLALAAAPFSVAHDVWLEPKDGGLMLRYGHGEKLDRYGVEQVLDIKATDCGGQSVALKKESREGGALIAFSDTKPALVGLFFDEGTFVKTTDGWKPMTKRQAEGKFTVVDSMKGRFYTKAILASCEDFSKPLGMVCEMIPGKNPSELKQGDEFPVRVLMNGKPLEGAEITYRDITYASPKAPKTDKDGRASIPIGASGLHIVGAWIKEPLKDDPDADSLFVYTGLTWVSK
jgi:nickel transport protein